MILEKLPTANAFPGRPFVVGSTDDDQTAADDFLLTNAETVTAVRWYGHFGMTATTSFEVSFFADAGGVPTLTPFFSESLSGVVGTGSGFIQGNTEHQVYEAMLSVPVSLPFGQTWFSVRSADPNAPFLWTISAFVPGDNSIFRTGDTNPWNVFTGQTDGRNEQAFALLNDMTGASVPEPTTSLLTAVGLWGLHHSRRRRRR